SRTDHAQAVRSFPTRRSSDLKGGNFPYNRSKAESPEPRLEQTKGSQACHPGRPNHRKTESSPAPSQLRLSQPGISVGKGSRRGRSEEHTSELQSRGHLVCRLL